MTESWFLVKISNHPQMTEFWKKSVPKNKEFPSAGRVYPLSAFLNIYMLDKAVVAKTLNLQKTIGYQWKDKIRIFHWALTVPSVINGLA